ncbi:MAG: hypothetical protein V3W36_06160, partial [Acidimicrobiia bacterium]
DRTLDGVDQSELLMGKSEKSARESIVIYVSNELFGVKWHNWKMLLKDLDEQSYAVRTLAYPTFYNQVVDPKEEHPEVRKHRWVRCIGARSRRLVRYAG